MDVFITTVLLSLIGVNSLLGFIAVIGMGAAKRHP